MLLCDTYVRHVVCERMAEVLVAARVVPAASCARDLRVPQRARDFVRAPYLHGDTPLAASPAGGAREVAHPLRHGGPQPVVEAEPEPAPRTRPQTNAPCPRQPMSTMMDVNTALCVQRCWWREWAQSASQTQSALTERSRRRSARVLVSAVATYCAFMVRL